MKTIIKFSIAILLIPALANSQNLSDAFRLSFHQINGTARASAMGNAFGSLGGDFTSLSINPAGIGIYRSSEFIITPTMKFSESELTVNVKDKHSSFMDNNYNMDVNNVGYVGRINISKTNTGLISFNWGIGMNKLMDFDQVSFGENKNSPVSFLDDIVNWANDEGLLNSYLNKNLKDIELRDWPTKLAWDTFLFDPALDNQGKEIDGQYVGILYENEKVNQRKSFEQKGGIKEVVINGGFNINHRLYIGATVGVNKVNLNQVTRYSEEFGDNSFVFSDDYSLSGNGYNVKLGVIFKPVNPIRLGFAFHTPTYYSLEQSNTYSMESFLMKNHYLEGTNVFDYKFYTPFKTVFSGALILGKTALLSADAEMLHYTTMKFVNPDVEMSDLKSQINENLKSTFNLRLGAEIKITQQFSLRGGYEFYGNPYKQSFVDHQPDLTDQKNYTVLSKNSSVLACGFGYNSGSFFADIAFRRLTSQYKLEEIQPNLENIVLKSDKNKALFTIGFRF